ncbi:MAG: hypothetical protein J6J17_00790 [Bacilli bacterium]|nr:hypothetical protein [Bacilli bacterium]
MKELLEDIKLNRVAYLLEKLETSDFQSKISILKKLEKMKITKNAGLFLIENSYRNFKLDNDIGGIGVSLIELCFKNYYDEYADAIKKVFGKFTEDAQNRIVYLLSSIENESSLKLYSDLVLKYYKDREFIPISNLSDRPQSYKYIFPKLYKALKFKNTNNNILILVSNYLSSGIVPKDDLKKNKKLIIDSISKVFDCALKLKFKNTFAALNNLEYRDIRFFLEICINIELYISNNKTEEYLEKLYKINDNQLKLFILDNYYRKGKEIDKFNINQIAKDPSSRYALFELLTIYEKINLMPKKYLNQELIAESDFYINFAISCNYNYEPKNITFYDKRNINGYDYYIFKFKCTYKYNNTSKDFLTNYICNVVGIDKLNGTKITDEFIGISGGYDKNKVVSTITYNHNKLLYSRIDKDSNIDEIINDLVPRIENKEKMHINIDDEIKEPKKLHFFTYILLLLFFIFVSLLIYCMLYVYGVGSINNVDNDNIRSVELNKEYEFTEINGLDIFNKPENEYYVLFYNNDDINKKSAYYVYINEYLKRNIKFYYVNLKDEKNKFLYTQNDLNFTLTNKNRLLKVKNKEFEYYIDGKVNILNEMQKEIESYKNAEKKSENK